MDLLTGSKKIKTAVFISGNGSNLKSLIKFSKTKKSPISIDIGDFFFKENFIRDFKLLPLPEKKTAVFTLLVPVDCAI